MRFRNVIVSSTLLLALSTSALADQSTIVYYQSNGYIAGVYIGLQPNVPIETGQARLIVQHDTGTYPDPLQFKVNLQDSTLIPSDQIIAPVDSVHIRAGSGDTYEVHLLKCSRSGAVLTGDNSGVYIGLYPIRNGQMVLPVPGQPPPIPNGTLLSGSHPFERGDCHAVVRAAPTPGQDVILIAQPGVEPVWIPVWYE